MLSMDEHKGRTISMVWSEGHGHIILLETIKRVVVGLRRLRKGGLYRNKYIGRFKVNWMVLTTHMTSRGVLRHVVATSTIFRPGSEKVRNRSAVIRRFWPFSEKCSKIEENACEGSLEVQ